MAEETVISEEQATQEVEAWVNFKKITGARKDDLSINMEIMKRLITGGEISINSDTFEITQNLKFPLSNGKNKLVFQPRIKGSVLQQEMIGVFDQNGRVFAKIAASTGQAKAMIGELDTEDLFAAAIISNFFSI